MTQPEFETALYHTLFDFFYDYGYEMLIPKKQFRREMEEGFLNVILSTETVGREHWLEVNIGLRFSPIEEIAQLFLDNYVDFRQESNTLITSIGKFNRNKYFRYHITDQEDIKLASEQLQEFMLQTGFAFLESHFNVAQLDKMMNLAPAKPYPHIYNQAHRCFKATVAAHLNGNPKFNQLVNSYQDYLQHSGTKMDLVINYDRMLKYLERH